MKPIYIFLFLKLLYLFSYGQDIPLQCGTVEPPNTLIISKAQASLLAADPTIRTIPLVFHVVWNPTLNPQDSAVAASKIATYINIMQKFTRKQNADTSQTVPAFRAVMADAKIEFCLKQVIFKRTTEVTFTTNDRIKNLPPQGQGSPAVDPLKHCNIWLGRLTGSLGGYAYFPTSTSVGAPFDGLVSILPTTHSDETVAEIIVHELWHYLGVYHTFSGSCTGDGDFCADTPPTDSPSGCTLSTVKCGNVTQVQNVMDYAHCGTGQTYDQVARTNAVLVGLRNQLWTSGTCSGNPGNNPPIISITTNGTTFTPPASIIINATASDPGGSVIRVEFFNGSTILSTDATSPYTFGWSNVQAGTYAISARAYDNGGAVTTSNVITVTVGSVGGNPPTCVLVSPANNSTHPQNYVPVSVTATDDGTVTKLEMFINGILANTFSPPLYNFSYQGYALGVYTIRARCTDNSNLSTNSATHTFTIGNVTNPPPVVSITQPTNGQQFTAPASVTVSATATDNGSVNRVEFYAGNLLWGFDQTSPYTITKTNVAAGSYTLTARAYDNQNASTVSSPVNITVSAGAQDSPVVLPIIHKANGSLEFNSQDGRKKIVP